MQYIALNHCATQEAGGVQILQLFQNISYLDLGEGEIGEAWASCGEGCRAVGRGRGSQVESITSRRKMLIEIVNYRGFIGGDRVSYPQCSWEEVFLFSMDFTVSQNFFVFVLQEANFCLKKLALAFLTACVYWFLTSLKSCTSWRFS